MERVLIDFGKLVQRIRAVWLNELLDFSRGEVEGGVESKMIRRTSGVSRFNIYKFSEVLG